MSSQKQFGAIEEDVLNEKTRKWYHLHKEMLPAKFAYFFLSMKDSPGSQFLILYLTSVGLTVSQAGIIAGTRLVGVLVGAPIWGLVDDKWSRPKLLISLLCLISSGLTLQMPFVAARLHQNALACTVPLMNGYNLTSFNSSLSDASNHTCGYTSVGNNKAQFWYNLLLSLLVMFFDGALSGITDSAVMSIIESSPRKLDYGKQRVFGAVGYGMGTLLTSVLVGSNFVPYYGLSKYWLLFFVYVFAVSCYNGSTIMLLRSNTLRTRKSEVGGGYLLLTVVKTLLQFHVMFFFATSLFMGVILALASSFTFKLMTDLNSPDVLMGMATVLGSASSVLMWAFTTKFVQLLGGPMSAIGVSAFAYFVRFLVYAYTKNPYLIASIQVLQVFTFTAFMASAVIYVKLISPSEIRSTMYNIMYSLHFGAGCIIGNWVGGFLYERWGGQLLFFRAAMFTLIWTVFVALYVLKEKCWKGNKRETADPERQALIKYVTDAEC